ncbi:serine/threonine-protein kinase pim-3-like [Oratosquilla oratoria]|uniref:serine/threonine-protein kinase pim-3-like n=1 Tax=Oratosquilla oratoria TaxID=337810 RepID=UPI003F770F0E
MRLRGYEVIEKLGEGGIASVYAARRTSDGALVAIKEVPLYMVDTWSDHEGRRVPEEVALLYKVQEVPGVIKLLDCVAKENAFFVVMELVPESMTIEDYMKTHGPFQEDAIKRIFSLLVKTVGGCLDAGVSHKDIKAENVLVFKNQETGDFDIKLIDFGCGEFVTGDRGTNTGGTEIYWPPEFVSKNEYLHVPATVWSLGTLLFYMLFRRDAFRTDEAILKASPTFGQEVPEQCRELLTMCFAKDPDERPSIEGILSHPWLQVPSKSATKSSAKRKRRKEEDLVASTKDAKRRKRRKPVDGNLRREQVAAHKKRRKKAKRPE